MHRRLLWITGAVAVLAFAVHRWGLASATSKSNATATNEGRLPADSVDGQRLLALEREVRSLRAELSSARREREPEPAAREEVPALEQAPGEEALPKSPLAALTPIGAAREPPTFSPAF